MATAFSSLVGSGSGGGVRQYDFITSSKTFVCTATGTLDIMLVGGHASGSVSAGVGFVGGAGAGGVAVKRARVTKGDSFTVVIGAGGTSVSKASGVAQGVAGGTSSVTGPGVSITATGGQPGEAKTTKPANGGLGGVGTGGDDNRQSGSGGSVIATATASAACGAGAVNVLGIPSEELRGGNINTSVGGSQSTGGGGVGGRGGDILGSASGITSGGGSGGPAQDAPSTVPGVNITGELAQASPVGFGTFWSWGFDCFGGGAAGSGLAGPGGGSGALGGYGDAPKSGIFAGTGASFAEVNSASGNRGPGQSVSVATGTATSGAGDSGCAVFVLRV